MKFLVDNQLPPALARLIRNELKAEAIHVVDVGLQDASDVELWSHASTNESVLMVKVMILGPLERVGMHTLCHNPRQESGKAVSE